MSVCLLHDVGRLRSFWRWPESGRVSPTLSQLSSTTADEVKKVLTTTRLKQSPTDVLPSSLMRSSVDVFAPVISHVANLSFSQGRFPAAFKTAQVLPLLKKPSLHKEQMSSYRPISNLSTVSKVIERLVLNRVKQTEAPPTRVAVLRSSHACSRRTGADTRQRRRYYTSRIACTRPQTTRKPPYWSAWTSQQPSIQ